MRDPWDEVSHPHEAKEHFIQYLKNEVLHLNFYRLHMLYFIVVVLISSAIVYGEGLANDPTEENGTRLRYIDALFLCTSAMTTTGLNSVNLGSLTAFQQAVLAVLLIIGNVIFVSTFVVIVRRHFFRRKLADVVQHSRSGRKILEDIEQQESKKSRHRNGLRKRISFNGQHPLTQKNPQKTTPPKKVNKELIRRRQYHHSTGRGFFPWPWETHTFQRLIRHPFRRLNQEWRLQAHSYISFEPDLDERGRFKNLNEHEKAELGGVEYRALEALLYILIIYQVFWFCFGTVFLVPYSYRGDVENIIKTSQPGNLNPGWFGFFAVITSFVNGGLNLLNSNYIPFQGYYLILIISAILTVAGNTQFPIILRLVIWTLSKITPESSRLRQTFLFLLHHPRRCFIYLFPAKETWYLFAIQVTIDLTMWVLFEILNLGIPAVMSIPPGTRTIDGLFQGIGLRTSGAYIITISYLAPALLVAYTVTMYISSFPIVMALRQTNTYEERSIGLDKGETGGGLGMHLRRQLAYDIWFQLLAWFLICIIERGKLNNGNPGFSIFNIMFEVTSAYGTVGLSTGVPYDDYSFSGAFQTGSKIVMLAVMLRGRHRGLPLAIDRSILLPGEDLMHKMDKEYGERGEWDPSEEQEIRKDEEESGKKDTKYGKGLSEQDPERQEEGDGAGEETEVGDESARSRSRSKGDEEGGRPHFELS